MRLHRMAVKGGIPMSCYSQQLSQVAKNYLCGFYEILDDMIDGMTGADLNRSLSHNFIVQMIPHHEAAIRMSESILRYTTFVPLQEIARNIITEQTKSIADMRAALSACGAVENTQEDICLYERRFRSITQTMFREMGCAPGTNNLNADFMREMIPHHQGAIRMLENALRFPICPELDPILRAIITSQERGVREMRRLLRCV